MPVRKPEVRSSSDAIGGLADRIRTLEDTVSRRCLPPGYEFGTLPNGDLEIVRTSDNAVVIVSF